jgi:hypothetical protein
LRTLISTILAISIAGCGGATSTGETNGGSGGGAGAALGGASGSSGGAGSTVSSGSGGGAAGTTGASGSGGGVIVDASVGTGGAPIGSGDGGVKPECTSEKDCKIVNDCCACEALPNNVPSVPCPAICKQSQCAALGLATPQAACVAGRCVVGFECDSSKVLCKSVPPQCPAGQIALVQGSCWQGGCVPANECASVKGCGDCTGDLVCAEFVQRGGPTVHCYDVPKECNGNFGCSCAGAGVCSGPGLTCADLSGLKGIACSCPAC